MKYYARETRRTRKNIRHTCLPVMMVLAAILVGLALLFANGLFFQVMFVPVIFGGVYAAACLLFDIAEDLRQ